MSKPMYRLVDGKGRVLIPKSMREAAKLEFLRDDFLYIF